MPHGIQWIDFISDILFPIWGILVIIILIMIYREIVKRNIKSDGEEKVLEHRPDLELICPVCGGNNISRKDGYCEICRKPTLGL